MANQPQQANLDHAKLTAYALGELDTAAAEEVELWLSGDDAARRYVEQVRQEASIITRAYRARAATLTDEQHDQLEDAIGGVERPVTILATLGIAAGLAAAACIALFFLLPGLGTPDEPEQTVLSDSVAMAPVDGQESTEPPREVLGLRESGQSPPSPTTPSVMFYGQASSGTMSGGYMPAESTLTRSAPNQTFALDRDSNLPTKPYTVASGDTLSSIAANQLGDANQWKLIAALNQQVLPQPDQIKPGMDLLLPDLERWQPPADRERYDDIVDNPFLKASDNPLSTFSVDVDTASYANIRRFLLNDGKLPPKAAVRIEEMVNYFTYDYSAGMQPAKVIGPDGEPIENAAPPFASSIEIAPAPWAPAHRLVRIGLMGIEPSADERPAANLVFLLDVSGSMNSDDKLPLLKQAFKLLTNELSDKDRVSIVVYAGAAGLVLPPTVASDRQKILDSLDLLTAGGSTAGGAGIKLAYQVAAENYLPGGINRVILASDGDFNVGASSDGELVDLVEARANPAPDSEHAGKAISLTVLGFGKGNLNDQMAEKISNKGNGNYAYIDSIREAQKVLVEQMGGTLHTIAKDVKIQVEFNPAVVESYRLIGYENRLLRKEDFNDDAVDAGDIGAGHTVTALYEVVPAALVAAANDAEVLAQIEEHRTAIANIEGLMEVARLTAEKQAALGAQIADHRDAIRELRAKLTPATPAVDDLRYQDKPQLTDAATGGELMTLKLRYKAPDAPAEQGTSTLLEFPVRDAGGAWDAASDDFQFAAAVAGFGMLLRDSPHRGDADFESVTQWASAGKGNDPRGYRAQFIELVEAAAALSTKPAAEGAE